MNDTTLPIPAKQQSTKTNPRQRSRGNGGTVRSGFGLHDWMTLLRRAKDLAQRKGAPLRRDITLAEVQTHNKPYDGWMVLRGKVYNIGPYLAYHPGGSEILEKCLGKDATRLFDRYHAWVNIENLIGPLLLGYLLAEKKQENEEEEGNDKGGIVLPTAANAVVTDTTSSNNEDLGFAMPKPRPPKGKPIESLRPRGEEEEDESEEEDLLKKLMMQPTSFSQR